MSRAGTKTFGIALLAGVLVALLLPAWLKFQVRQHAKAHIVGNVYQDLQNLTLAAAELCEIEGQTLTNLIHEAPTQAARELYARIAASPEARGLARLNAASTRQRTICDRWEREVYVTTRRGSSGTLLVLRSFGPNGRDEGGKGDDIVVESVVDSHGR